MVPVDTVRGRAARRLALFDLDDTLTRQRPAFGRFAADFVARHGLDPGAVPWMIETWEPYRRRDEFFAAVRERFALAEPVADLWADYRRRMPGFVTLRPEVRDGLTELRRAGWRLGIVSNGQADSQLGKIARTGLDTLVDAVCVSGAVGVRKPDREIFRLAAEGAGCDLADGGWMIGDNPVADVAGGVGAGLSAVWVNGKGEDPASAPAAAAVVPDVLDAIGLLLAES